MAAPRAPQTAPLALPALGVDKIARFGFIYAEGAPAYEKAVVAKTKTHDWAAVKAGCEAALAKDPQHLDAHWLLAAALAQTGDAAGAVDHVVTAIAGDYFFYAPKLGDDDLKPLMATPHGQAVTALAQRIHDEYVKEIKAGVWLVARRSAFKWPAATGVQPASSRGELYAFDRDSKRYLRLTHTDHQVVGFVRAPDNAETAVLGFDKVDHPKADDAPALVARPWLVVLDSDFKPSPRANLPSARMVSVGYGAGDQLLVATAAANGRWGLGDAAVASVDKSTGKLTKVAEPPSVPRIEFTLDEGRLVRKPEGVDAAWTGDPTTAPTLKLAAGATITVPESGQTAQLTVAASPGGGHVAFATAVDACAADAAPSLYVADGKTGALKHVLTAKSRFATRWIDAATLAYDDGDGAIRLWDATTAREAQKLDNKPGLALDVLSAGAAPLCKQAPPAIEHAGSDEPLPVEEGSASPGAKP